MVKKVLLGILAALLLVAGGALGAAAVWAYGTLGPDGVMRFDAGTISPGPQDHATIVDIDRFSATVPYIGELGTITLSISSGERGDPADTLFLGAAATTDVDAYLKGTAYAVALKDGDEWTTRAVPGEATPALPREQTFWIAQGVGAQPAIPVPPDRPLTLVMMHPSTVPTGPVTLSILFTVPQASNWVLGMAIAAGVLVLLAVLLVVLIVRMRTRRGRHQVGSSPRSHAADG